MEPPSDEDRPSAVADAIGGAAVYSARVAARAWRGRLETAFEELLSTPEVGRVLDRALSGPLPEEVTRSLVRHRVAERVVHELAAAGELERLLDQALASPETLVIVDRVLASEAMARVLERTLAGPEIRGAMASQSAGLAEHVAADVRDATAGVDSRLSSVRTPTEFAGVASRGVALVVDALVILGVSLAIGAAAGLVGALVGGIRPHWLAGTLLGLAGIAVGVGYFVLFWQTAGQTPGMRLMHVRVLPAHPQGRMTVGRAIVRTVGLALAIVPCFLGFVPALFDRRRRALPDYLAGTVVVYDDGAREAT
jgi:uncharacterized RDD family membrane protein YckC/plasmid stabilization system protein ParE